MYLCILINQLDVNIFLFINKKIDFTIYCKSYSFIKLLFTMEVFINSIFQEFYNPSPELFFDPFKFGLITTLTFRFPEIYESPLLSLIVGCINGFTHQLTAYLAYKIVPVKYHSIVAPLLLGSFTYAILYSGLQRRSRRMLK